MRLLKTGVEYGVLGDYFSSVVIVQLLLPLLHFTFY